MLASNHKIKNSLFLCDTLNLIAVVEEVYKKCLWHKVFGETDIQEKSSVSTEASVI